MKQKTLKIIYWVITVLFALFMLFSALTEVMQIDAAKQLITSLGYPLYLNTILGVAKILGVIALLQWSCKALKEWAYAGFTIDIIGAATSMYFTGLGIGSAIFCAAFLIPVFLSYWLWKKTS